MLLLADAHPSFFVAAVGRQRDVLGWIVCGFKRDRAFEWDGVVRRDMRQQKERAVAGYGTEKSEVADGFSVAEVAEGDFDRPDCPSSEGTKLKTKSSFSATEAISSA